MKRKDLRIIYMGTPDFAVEPLKALLDAGYNVVAVVTNPDKPAGRGQKIMQSAVKIYATQRNLKVLQPVKFRDNNFLNELKELKADLQIVVAFKMLPEVVWNMPPLGTLNLHASLLPQYRGAAPINWAIINGETQTGVTTFLLQHQIDTGNILFQESISIEEEDNAEAIHNKLMKTGAQLVVKTVRSIEENDCPQILQKDLIPENTTLKKAPKIFKEDCKINWNQEIEIIHNHIRGLSPYPAAWTQLHIPEQTANPITLKIFSTRREYLETDKLPGTLLTDEKNYLKVVVKGGVISILELQQAGKKRMQITDFLRGFQQLSQYSLNLS